MDNIEVRKKAIKKQEIRKAHICQSEAEKEKRVMKQKSVAETIEEVGGISKAMEIYMKGGNMPYSQYFEKDLKKYEWEFDDDKFQQREKWKSFDGEISEEEKLDIIEENVYSSILGDNFPFEGRSRRFTKRKEKRARKESKKVRKSAEAFINKYQGKYALYKRYNQMGSFKNRVVRGIKNEIKNIKGRVASIFSKDKDDRE